LTPEPYAVRAPEPEPLRRRVSPYWLAAPVIAAAALLLFFWPREPSLQEINKAIEGFDCASIRVVRVYKSEVVLSGDVASDEEIDEIRRRVLSVPRVKSLIDNLSIISRPFCKVMQVLGPLKNDDTRRASRLSINPTKGCDGVYYEGENLVVEVAAQKP